MKNIKIFLTLSLIIVFHFSTKAQITTTPKSFSKIHFIFHHTCNIIVNEQGVFADTLLLKFYFPNLKYKKVSVPNEDNIFGGFVAFNNLSETDVERIIGTISHSTYETVGLYNVKKNRTFLLGKRIKDDVTAKKLKQILNKSYGNGFYSRKYFSFNNNLLEVFNSFGGIRDIKMCPERNLIKWIDKDLFVGEYNEGNEKITTTNLVQFSPDLDKHITPILLFGNCEYGIFKIKSVFETIELKEVYYD